MTRTRNEWLLILKNHSDCRLRITGDGTSTFSEELRDGITMAKMRKLGVTKDECRTAVAQGFLSRHYIARKPGQMESAFAWQGSTLPPTRRLPQLVAWVKGMFA